jgi:hypothetical protein
MPSLHSLCRKVRLYLPLQCSVVLRSQPSAAILGRWLTISSYFVQRCKLSFSNKLWHIYACLGHSHLCNPVCTTASALDKCCHTSALKPWTMDVVLQLYCREEYSVSALAMFCQVALCILPLQTLEGGLLFCDFTCKAASCHLLNEVFVANPHVPRLRHF